MKALRHRMACLHPLQVPQTIVALGKVHAAAGMLPGRLRVIVARNDSPAEQL
jgi:hypothetical protein